MAIWYFRRVVSGRTRETATPASGSRDSTSSVRATADTYVRCIGITDYTAHDTGTCNIDIRNRAVRNRCDSVDAANQASHVAICSGYSICIRIVFVYVTIGDNCFCINKTDQTSDIALRVWYRYARIKDFAIVDSDRGNSGWTAVNNTYQPANLFCGAGYSPVANGNIRDLVACSLNVFCQNTSCCNRRLVQSEVIDRALEDIEQILPEFADGFIVTIKINATGIKKKIIFNSSLT